MCERSEGELYGNLARHLNASAIVSEREVKVFVGVNTSLPPPSFSLLQQNQ